MSDTDDVGRVEGQISRECELTDSGKMKNQVDDKNVNSCEPKEKVRKLGEDEMNEVDDEDGVLSDFSDISQVSCDQVYSLEEIHVFLDETFGKVADVRNFFSDVKKFESSVLYWQRREGEENLSKRKRFRLKFLLNLERGKPQLNVNQTNCEMKCLSRVSLHGFLNILSFSFLFLYLLMDILRVGSLNINGGEIGIKEQ